MWRRIRILDIGIADSPVLPGPAVAVTVYKIPRPRSWRLLAMITGLFLILALPMVPAQAQDHLAQDHLALHLVGGPDFRPLSDPGLSHGGMAAEIITAAFAKVGDSVTIEFEPWPRGYADARKLRYDGTFPYAETPERERDFLFSDLIYAQIAHPYVLAGSTWSVSDLDKLTGKTMCNPQGYLVQAPIKGLVESGAIKVESPAGMPQCFKMLEAGRVDFVDCTEIQAKASAMQVFGATDAVKALPAVIGTGGSYLIVSRQHAAGDRIIADFNRGLAQLKQSGAYDRIVQRQLDSYFGQITN